MEGVNHGQFASGALPKAVTDHDLNPEVSQDRAYDTIANYTNAFMVYTRNDTKKTDIKKAISLLDDAYSSTSSLMKVHINEYNWDGCLFCIFCFFFVGFLT